MELVALVVGGVDYGDADRIVHLLTRHGRVSVFAHGARTSKKRFAGALDPFTSICATLELKRGGREGMQTMRSAVVEHSRLAIRDSLEKIALASYVVELAAAVAPEGEACDSIYELALQTLDRLVERPATLSLRRTFELWLIEALGYLPRLEGCAFCGGEASPIYLDLAHGGVLCAEHRGHAYEIGPRTLAWMRSVYARSEPPAGLGAEGIELAAKKLATPAAQFFSGLIGRRMKSIDMLETLGL